MEKAAAQGNSAQNYLQVTNIKPFENIALAFSGGGYRAASYALGVLSYLNKLQFNGDTDPLKGKPLLQQVTYMSSASGGTITTALYALYNAQGKTFGQFYVKLFETLTGDFILQKALTILSDKKRWEKGCLKGRNIINAFSVAYDEFIFEGNTLQALYHGSTGSAHLQEVCFNTTEFYTGLSFRQDMKLSPDTGIDPYYKFGNENIFVEHNTAQKIKLGDALAASSCFPGGFEPIIFPNDFTHNGLTEGELKMAITLKPQTGDKEEMKFIAEKRIGLMDGGVTDNQGLQSMMYADGRRIRRETSFSPFDFMLVNDVGSYFIKPYVMPPQPEYRGIDLSGLNWIIIIAFLLAAACAGWGVYEKSTPLALTGGALIVLPLIFILAVWFLKSRILGGPRSSSPLRKDFTEQIIKLLVHYFTRTPLVVLKQMLTARSDSVLMLNTNVFMKRIRQLLYNTFYDSPQWENRGKGNHIYDLSFSGDLHNEQNPPPTPFLNPSREIKIVAQTAFNMGTTLWFDKANIEQQHSEACIIACGQFTTCYNLLGYIEKLLLSPSAYDAIYQGRLLALKRHLTDDYEHFKIDPFFMYNQQGRDYQINNFEPLNVKDIPFPTNW
jgi:predicted acylesterase/phospholipase RssA